MEKAELTTFCIELIKEEILPILAQNFADLRENARQHGPDFFMQTGSTAQFKDDGKGLVSDGEVKAEKIIRQKFERNYPEITILGEELGDSEQLGEYSIVIDPVDGTTAMIQSAISGKQTGAFGITLGFLNHERLAGGIVFELIVDQNEQLKIGKIWQGWVGDENPAQPDASEAKLETLCSSAPQVMFTTPAQRHAFHALERSADKILLNRNCIGFMDILENPNLCVIESDLSIHDAAAIVPILQSKGVKVTDFNGVDIKHADSKKEYKILAGWPSAHQETLNIYSRALNEKPLEVSSDSVLNSVETLNTAKFKQG